VEENMSDVQRYIKKRKKIDNDFADGFDTGYEQFKIGMVIKELRIKEGMTQEELAGKLHTKKSVISRMENHSEDIRLSTLNKVAEVFGKKLQIAIE
jgi:HTH-type transcriptional regulator / antitoxin HipB